MSDPFDDDPRQDQLRLGHIDDRFREHDLAFLRLQGAAELAAQVKARQELAGYLNEMYEWVKYGLKVPHPALTPEYSALAGMCDMANNLAGRAKMVLGEQRDLGN